MSSSVEVLHMDCLDYSRPAGSVVITDPPFNVRYHYNKCKDNLEEGEWLDLLTKVASPPCVLVLYPEAMFRVALHWGIVPDRVVSWVYPSNTPRQTRLLAWFGVAPDFRKVGQPYRNPKDKRIAARIAEGKEARLYDWWEVNQVKNVSKDKTEHPCQMPVEVMRRAVGITPGDHIIDPFCGSGTTLVACAALGRPATGIDMDAKYVDITKARLGHDV